MNSNDGRSTHSQSAAVESVRDLIDELLRCGWILVGTLGQTHMLANPNKSLVVHVQCDSAEVRLVFAAASRPGPHFRLAWTATTPLLPSRMVLAVSAANDAEATRFPFYESDAVAGSDLLTAAGWRAETAEHWISPDGRREVQAHFDDAEDPAFPIRIRLPGGCQIHATRHIGEQVLAAFALGDTTPEPDLAPSTVHADDDAPDVDRLGVALFQGRWQPATSELFRRMFVHDIAHRIAADKATKDEAFAVPAVWSSTASPSERGQQHIRLALAMAGIHVSLDSPELFDQAADTIPAVIADLRAIASRIGLDPDKFPPPHRC
ncbi:hypothetical protein [Catenulispora rubra]|uniref:hypothetical protein n=1 Tax=Catenulispora rubra TaxID=280293 RepID=UPI0018924F9A|nr:hypothetical protein [Catenulispora rubra]